MIRRPRREATGRSEGALWKATHGGPWFLFFLVWAMFGMLLSRVLIGWPLPCSALGFWSGPALATGTAWAGLCLCFFVLFTIIVWHACVLYYVHMLLLKWPEGLHSSCAALPLCTDRQRLRHSCWHKARHSAKENRSALEQCTSHRTAPTDSPSQHGTHKPTTNTRGCISSPPLPPKRTSPRAQSGLEPTSKPTSKQLTALAQRALDIGGEGVACGRRNDGGGGRHRGDARQPPRREPSGGERLGAHLGAERGVRARGARRARRRDDAEVVQVPRVGHAIGEMR